MNLAEDEVHLYLCFPGDISASHLLSRYKTLLSKTELEQMERFYFKHHRHQYLITRSLVRTCLSAYYPIDPREWSFGQNEFGKPEIVHPQADLSIRFNLSHADGLIICGIAKEYDIGVDVEDIQRSTRSAFNSLWNIYSAIQISWFVPIAGRDLRWRVKRALTFHQGGNFH